MPGNLLAGYDLEDFASFTRYKDYDILNIQFGEMEGPDVWTEYDLGSLIAIREELMGGDLRALFIVWLAAQEMMGSYDEEEEYEVDAPPVPHGMGKLTDAQNELAELFQVPEELLMAAASHSVTRKKGIAQETDEEIASWIQRLPSERGNEYLLRLAHNEPGLSRLFLRELRELGRSKTDEALPAGERVTYVTLLAESKAVKVRMEREKREQAEAERRHHLKDIHDHRDTYWRQVEKSAQRSTASGYDDATKLLVELRDAAAQFNETKEFQARFSEWVQSQPRRPAISTA